MQKILIILLFLTVLVSSCTALNGNHQSKRGDYFKVEVEQGGKIIKEKNGVIQLDKQPFKFRLTYFKTQEVYVSSSWGKYYFDYPDDQNIFECKDELFYEECRFISVKTGAEDNFNVNKDIYVGNEQYQHVWFYDALMEWYRMDRGVTVKDGVIHAVVTVENIYDMDKQDDGNFEESEYKYPIENITQDIYMVFAKEQFETGMEHPQELQREKFILKFN